MRSSAGTFAAAQTGGGLARTLHAPIALEIIVTAIWKAQAYLDAAKAQLAAPHCPICRWSASHHHPDWPVVLDDDPE